MFKFLSLVAGLLIFLLFPLFCTLRPSFGSLRGGTGCYSENVLRDLTTSTVTGGQYSTLRLHRNDGGHFQSSTDNVFNTITDTSLAPKLYTYSYQFAVTTTAVATTVVFTTPPRSSSPPQTGNSNRRTPSHFPVTACVIPGLLYGLHL
jgi:hypothetical protein